MPWETVVSTAILSSVAKAVTDPIVRGAVKLFQERNGGVLPFVQKAFADRYPSLTAEQLLDFYEQERALSVELCGTTYTLPVSLEIGPRDDHGAPPDVKFSLSSEKFRVPASIDPYTHPVLEKLRNTSHKMFPGDVASLRRLERNDAGEWIGEIVEGEYYDAVATNFTMDHKPARCPQSLREHLSGRSRRLGDFAGSELVNHLGVVCILESDDGKLVVQRRGVTTVTNRGGTLSSSASGAVEFDDLARLGRPIIRLRDVTECALRETFRELGVKPSSMEFLGLIREFVRGGKPELYVFCRSEKPFRQIVDSRRTAQERAETTQLFDYPLHTNQLGEDRASREAFKSRMHEIVEKVGRDANLTLITGILLLKAAKVGFY